LRRSLESWSSPRGRPRGDLICSLIEPFPSSSPRRRRRREPPGKARAVPAAGASSLPSVCSSQAGLVGTQRCTVATHPRRRCWLAAQRRRRLVSGGWRHYGGAGVAGRLGAEVAACTRWPRLDPASPSGLRRVGLLTVMTPPGVVVVVRLRARRVAAALPYVQQRGGGEFMGPIWAWPG
jgi:hypothetical protein